MAGFGEDSRLATHYEVLGLTPAILDSQDDPSIVIKQAYRRALLRHHPDKALSSSSSSSSSSFSQHQQSFPSINQASVKDKTPQIRYTIDQITQALTILSSPRQRSDYDASLRLSRTTTTSAGGGGGRNDQARFQTGVENVDLDDLAFDEREERWYRPCRCGNDRGYCFQEDDLIEVEHEGVLMVGCQDCSLWLKIHFAVVEDAEDDRASSEDGKSRTS